MLSFNFYISNIVEAAKKESDGMSANTKGVLHELLVGKHLNNGKHMDAHPDVNGDSPEQAHDKLKASISDESYAKADSRAKKAADDIRKKVGGNVSRVQWTSKPGDLKRSTGIHATQQQDASDIVVTTPHPTKKGAVIHHGISLKVTDTKGHIPVSNPGLESTYGGEHILEKHRAAIKKDYPELAGKNAQQRKEIQKSNPAMEKEIKARSVPVLHAIAQHTHDQLQAMTPQQRSDHIRNYVLKANKTPMQEAGHQHMRHTTHGVSDVSFSHQDPASEHEHILNDPENITVHKQGAGLVFKHKGKIFAKHRMKYNSQSDPLSSVKGSGSGA